MKGKYTIIIVPEETSKVKKYKLAGGLLKFLLFTLAVALIINAFIIYDYFRIRNYPARLSRLQEEKNIQAAQIRSFAIKIASLKKQLQKLSELDHKLRVIADLEPVAPDNKPYGVGGAYVEDSLMDSVARKRQDLLIKKMHSELEHLKVEAYIQQESFESLESFLRNKKLVLASTPSIWPTKGWVTSGFGFRKSPFTGRKEFHRGIDIATRIGTPVIAPADGIVAYRGVEGGLGLVLVINHGYGFKTRYGHLSKVLVKVGQRVKRGQKIALVGNTGRSTGPHLHYEVSLHGVPVNPRNYILD